MAKKKAKGRAATPAKRPAAKKKTERHATRKSRRPVEETFPELGNLKDAILMRHAKAYSDEMFASEEALSSASGEKQALRNRMSKLGATFFSGHGYEFSRVEGEEKFTARKVKRGAPPVDTAPEVGDQGGTTELDADGEPLDDSE